MCGINRSLFAPLSDSSRFMEFRQKMPQGSHNTSALDHIDILTNPIKMQSPELIDKFKEKYKDKDNLFIIEDFSGSGTTIESKIKQIIDNYKFKCIYFCPLIISSISLKNLDKLKSYAESKNQQFKIINGVELGDEYSILSDTSNKVWSVDEKKALTQMCQKYFKSHFYINGYLYKDHNEEKPLLATPYGYKDCGLAIVLHSNCPNNSLPIIWEESNNWKFLFKRHERHLKRVYDGTE